MNKTAGFEYGFLLKMDSTKDTSYVFPETFRAAFIETIFQKGSGHAEYIYTHGTKRTNMVYSVN